MPGIENKAVRLEVIRDAWAEAWPKALGVWSKFTRLRPPVLCLTRVAAREEGLSGSFAMIRLVDQAVIVDLQEVVTCGVADFGVEILAHEIGHHVLAPASLTEHARMIARMRWALPTVEQHAPKVANLYTDLLINDRLQRSAELRLSEIYRALSQKEKPGAVWKLYMRIYEILWSLERGTLGGGKTSDAMEGDAWLGARLIRTYAREWMEGSGRFAALLLPHLLEDKELSEAFRKWFDTQNAAVGGMPAGLVEEDPDERSGAIHPANDPALSDDAEGNESRDTEGLASRIMDASKNLPAKGQCREPFQYGEILRAAGLNISDHETAVRYYRERARPHLIPFPSRRIPEHQEPLMEGLESWDIGNPLDEIDWFQTVLQSPKVIPGLTTVQRVWGTTEGKEPKLLPIDLDLYVDSSGSMPHPQQITSFLTLAGAILCLSALRAGARVQVTLWSGKNQFMSTNGFISDEAGILRILTGFYGGATAFPIHKLRDTYEKREAGLRTAHIMVISDDGVSTMFDRDEQGNSGWNVAEGALQKAGGGGTLVLNLPSGWEDAALYQGALAEIRRAREQQGWDVHRVSNWDEIVEFARKFSRLHYGKSNEPTGRTRPSGGRS